MKIKDKFFFIFTILLLFILADISANLIKVRPLLWKRSYYSYLNIGWYTWHGADHLYDKTEIHINQTNGFKTRGVKPNKNFSKNIILLGDSSVETSLRLNEMPEKYLRDNFSKTNVISFASYGWSTDQQLIHLEKYINEIKPQKVVLWLKINDILGNITKHGFLGRKPIFKIKKNNDKYILSGPDVSSEKNYFEYSYFYRSMNKILYSLKVKNKKTLSQKGNDCSKIKNYTDKEVFLKEFFNESRYTKFKTIYNHHEKPYANRFISLENKNTFPNFDKWQKNKIDNFLKYDLSRLRSTQPIASIDPLYLNLVNKTDEFIYAEILTNKLLNRIQELSNKNNSEFYIFFVNEKSRYQPFIDDKRITICHKDKERVYSNKAFNNILKNIFKNIKNVKIINLEENFGLDNYDLFDGHKSSSANRYIMYEVYKYING